MKNMDIKAMFVFQADIDGKDYDKIINFLEQKGYGIQYPGFIGTSSSLATTGWAVGDLDVEAIKPTSAEKSLAKEIGVDANSVARLSEYMTEYSKVVKDMVDDGKFTQKDADEFLNSGIFSTFKEGRESAQSICDDLKLDYEGKKIEREDGKQKQQKRSGARYENENLGVKLFETNEGFQIMKKEMTTQYVRQNDGSYKTREIESWKLVDTVKINSEYRDEFVSEFKEAMSKMQGFGKISEDQIKKIDKSITNEIKVENTFGSALDNIKGVLYEAQKTKLEKEINELSEKIENTTSPVMKKILETAKEIKEETLEDVNKAISELDKKEVLDATNEKVQCLKYQALLEKQLNDLQEKIEQYQGSSFSKFLLQQKASIMDMMDEVNDRIEACERRIEKSNSADEQKTLLDEIAKIKENIEKISGEKSDEIINGAKELLQNQQEGLKNIVKSASIVVDNTVGDIKDVLEKVGEKYQDNGVVAAANNIYSNVEDKLQGMAKEVTEAVKNIEEAKETLVEGVKDIVAKGIEIVRERAENVEKFISNKFENENKVEADNSADIDND